MPKPKGVLTQKESRNPFYFLQQKSVFKCEKSSLHDYIHKDKQYCYFDRKISPDTVTKDVVAGVDWMW